jgi:hypothetical protein
LAIALTAAARSSLPVILRDTAKPSTISEVVKRHTTAVIVDPGSWRNAAADENRPFDLPQGHAPADVHTWGNDYLRASGAAAMFTPSLYLRGADWPALRAQVDTIVNALPADSRVIGLIATDAAMLNATNVDTFLNELQSLKSRRVAFLFGEDRREFLGDTGRLTGLRKLLAQHPAAWLLGVDALAASDALCGGAGLAAVGIRPVVRWPSPPGTKSNGGGAKDFIPGVLDRDLLTYHSSSVYADWYIDMVSAACGTCGRHPESYNSSPSDKDAVDEHNVHAAAGLCADLLSVPADQRDEWLMLERIEAASRYRDLNNEGTKVTLDRTLSALIQRDCPGWSVSLQL